MLLEQEERELQKRKQIVALEVEWASRGVKARVKRNVRRLGRVREMRDQLKADESAYRRATKKITYEPIKDLDNHTKIICEFYNAHKSFESEEQTIKILENFNIRIKRGDRIGIIGKNGSGKSTFLRLILKELEADKGSVKVQKTIEFSYFDQNRSDLRPNDRLKDVMAPNGGDYIDVRGKTRHIYGYLKDFMFDPSTVLDKVGTLSGGQKNRLKLAKILANPKSCLILDEPTNDLDMETLDMLEEILINYEGTLLLVSHDRDFLDQTVTKILAFEGDGKIEQCVGGYSDYLDQKKSPRKITSSKNNNLKAHNTSNEEKVSETNSRKKLTYKLEFELKNLPIKIQEKEKEIEAFNEKLSDGDFYNNDPDGFVDMTKALKEAKTELDNFEIRWLELEEEKG